MKVQCRTCRFFEPLFEIVDESDYDMPGRCGWDPGPLPYAWRYMGREKMGVSADELIDCPTHKHGVK